MTCPAIRAAIALAERAAAEGRIRTHTVRDDTQPRPKPANPSPARGPGITFGSAIDGAKRIGNRKEIEAALAKLYEATS